MMSIVRWDWLSASHGERTREPIGATDEQGWYTWLKGSPTELLGS